MEEFKKDLLSICKRSIAGTVVFLVLAVVCVALGSVFKGAEYKDFSGMESGYKKIQALYLMGPFAEETEDGGAVYEYYIAEDADGYWNVLAADAAAELSVPVYGEDIAEEDIDNLVPQTIYGYSRTIPYELSTYLVAYFEGTGLDVTSSNYREYFGDHYLDSTDTNANGSKLFFYMLAGVMVIFAVTIYFAGGVKRRAVKKQLKKMENSGELTTIYMDFSSEPKFFFEKAGLAVSRRYVLDFRVSGMGFHVVPLQDVVNVFQCNMVDGQPTAMNYIALETVDGKRTLVASCQKTGKEFDEAVAQLKRMVNGGR